MTNSFKHYYTIAFGLISLFFDTYGLYAWDRGHLGGPDQMSQTDVDTAQKDIVRKERHTNTPVSSGYKIEIAKPHQQPAIERQPVPPVTPNRLVQQERHSLPADTTPFQPRENIRKTMPGLSERTPVANRDISQPQPFVADQDIQNQRPNRPNVPVTHKPVSLDRNDNTLIKPVFEPRDRHTRDSREIRYREHIEDNRGIERTPISADKNDNTLIKPVFEPRDRHTRDSREIRYREHIEDNRGIERTPIHRPVIGERIYPARGMAFYRALPSGYNRVFIRNQLYFTHQGRFYRKAYNGFIWIVPPVGCVVTTLPLGYTSFIWGGVEYYTYAGIYYRPTYGGYVVAEEPDDLPCPWEIDPPPFDFVRVNTELLNVRSGPGEDFPVIEQCMYDERLQVLGSYGDWYYIRLINGRRGWVLSYYTYPENSYEPNG